MGYLGNVNITVLFYVFFILNFRNGILHTKILLHLFPLSIFLLEIPHHFKNQEQTNLMLIMMAHQKSLRLTRTDRKSVMYVLG